jgi:hypothetical protein
MSIFHAILFIAALVGLAWMLVRTVSGGRYDL